MPRGECSVDCPVCKRTVTGYQKGGQLYAYRHGFQWPCKGSNKPAQPTRLVNEKSSFGYWHNREREEFTRMVCLPLGLDPAVFNSDVYFEVNRRMGNRHKYDLSLRQRQERDREHGEKWIVPQPAPQDPNKLTAEEAAYLAELLSRQNDPMAMAVATKVLR